MVYVCRTANWLAAQKPVSWEPVIRHAVTKQPDQVTLSENPARQRGLDASAATAAGAPALLR